MRIGTADKCFLPKAVGRCRAAHKRFFYNSNDEKCEEFTYGGCGGNDNRFNSFEQCELECVETLKPGDESLIFFKAAD